MFLMCNLFSLAFLTKWISKPRASHLLDALFKSKGKHLTFKIETKQESSQRENEKHQND